MKSRQISRLIKVKNTFPLLHTFSVLLFKPLSASISNLIEKVTAVWPCFLTLTPAVSVPKGVYSFSHDQPLCCSPTSATLQRSCWFSHLMKSLLLFSNDSSFLFVCLFVLLTVGYFIPGTSWYQVNISEILWVERMVVIPCIKVKIIPFDYLIICGWGAPFPLSISLLKPTFLFS